MVATETRQPVLATRKDWDAWIKFIEYYANGGPHPMWKYINPDTPDDEVPILEEPQFPGPSDVNGGDDIDFDDLTGSQRWELEYRLKLYNRAEKKYDAMVTHLGEIRSKIFYTVAENEPSKFVDSEHPREMLKELATRFRPDPGAQRLEVAGQWAELCRGPNKFMSHDAWLRDWLNTYRRGIALRFLSPDISLPQLQFLEAVDRVYSQFAFEWDQRIRVDNDRISFPDLVSRYDAYYQRKQQRQGSTETRTLERSGAFPAHLRGESDASNTSSTEKSKLRPCICGKLHKFEHCWYINASQRPENFVVDQKIMRKVQNAAVKNGKIRRLMGSQQAGQANTDSHRNNETPDDYWGSPTSYAATALAYACNHTSYDLVDSFVYDTASTDHTCNDRARFVSYEPLDPYVHRLEGVNGDIPVHGRGAVIIEPELPFSSRTMRVTLPKVIHTPDLALNLVSATRLEDIGILPTYTKNGRCLARVSSNGEGRPIAKMQRMGRFWTLDYRQPNPAAYAARRTKQSMMPPRSTASKVTWHNRIGHLSGEVVKKLPQNTDGVTVSNDNSFDRIRCSACQLANPSQQISRRPMHEGENPWDVIHFDLVPMELGFNGHTIFVHFYCPKSAAHNVFSLFGKHEASDAVADFDSQLRNQGFRPKIWHTDVEQSLGNDTANTIRQRGIHLHQSAPYTHNQNGPAERAGAVIMRLCRALMIFSNLPHNLWPLGVEHAVWILNRVPTSKLNWRSPYEVIRGSKPNLGNLRTFGSLSYVRIPDDLRSKLERTRPRAVMGYLVGYQALNIFRVWVPEEGKVLVARDVTIDETTFYDPQRPIGIGTTRAEEVRQLLPEPEFTYHHNDESSDEDVDILDLQNRRVRRDRAVPPPPTRDNHEQLPQTPARNRLPTLYSANRPATMNMPGGFGDSPALERYQGSGPYSDPNLTPQPPLERPPPTPASSRSTQPSSTDHRVDDFDDDEASRQLRMESLEFESRPQFERRPRQQNTATRRAEISSDVNQENIISTGRRARRPRRDDQNYQSYFASFAMALSAQAHKDEGRRFHRDELPEPPKYFHQIHKLPEPHRSGFLKAANLEYDTVWRMGTFQETSLSEAESNGGAVPLKWVLSYKLDSDGYLVRYKARLCLRGDLQVNFQETYAATMTLKAIRVFFALAAIFDYEIIQHDISSAYLNSFLDIPVYARFPEGMPGDRAKKCLQVLRALYGTKQAGRLWQLEFVKTLKELGLIQSTEEICLFQNEKMILIFFVDDVLTMFKKRDEAYVKQFWSNVAARYDVRELGDVKWFLGMRVKRDRTRREIYLCQDSYVEQMTTRFNLQHAQAFPPTPLSVSVDLKKNQDPPIPSLRQLYQQKVGSLLYASIATRPDLAFAAIKLSQFMSNPTPVHMTQIDRAIRYAYRTRHLAIRFTPPTDDEDRLIVASDAAYADNEDRKSTGAYLFKLYNGPIDWMAHKQNTVSLSSTEAEIIAVSEATKEMKWWHRLFDNVSFTNYADHCTPTVLCDNRQAVLAMLKDGPIQTRLKHVDIRNHWVRQELRYNAINLNWVHAENMPADGFTKPLSVEKHEDFLRQLGLSYMPS